MEWWVCLSCTYSKRKMASPMNFKLWQACIDPEIKRSRSGPKFLHCTQFCLWQELLPAPSRKAVRVFHSAMKCSTQVSVIRTKTDERLLGLEEWEESSELAETAVDLELSGGIRDKRWLFLQQYQSPQLFTECQLDVDLLQLTQMVVAVDELYM